jgi:hypothetical protein
MTTEYFIGISSNDKTILFDRIDVRLIRTIPTKAAHRLFEDETQLNTSWWRSPIGKGKTL